MKPVDEIPDDELGAALDATIDARIEHEHVDHVLQRIYTDLDTVADSHAIKQDLINDLREIERRVAEIRHSVTDEKIQVAGRENKIRERLRE